MKQLGKMTPKEVALHIQDMEGRAYRLAEENADLREKNFNLELDLSQTTVECLALGQRVGRLQTENQAMLNALVKAGGALQILMRKEASNAQIQAVVDAFEAVDSFVGNLETETLTDKPAEHGTV